MESSKHKVVDDVSSDAPRKQSKKTSEHLLTLNSDYTAKILEDFKDSYTQRKNFLDDNTGCGIYQEPFRHCVFPNFIQESDELDKLEEELSSLTFKEKNNDLYKFHQTYEDLKVTNTAYIKNLRKLIYETFKNWLHNITDINFTDQIDMSCAKYEYTDVLLCHDDELEGRRIAFIYYLVPPSWTDKDGGCLDLFSVDENNQPDKVVKSLCPVRNNFVFFEVTPVSFHQVAEVLSKEKTKLSISGWFHGPAIDRPAPYMEPKSTLQAAVDVDEDVFYSWINATYLDTEVQAEIKQRFETESEIELENFLQPSKYGELKAAISSHDVTWKSKGPANKRCLMYADMEKIPKVIKECVEFLQSDAMFLILSHLTGLKLHKLYVPSDSEDSDDDSKEVDSRQEKSDPCCHCEVRQWSHGCYTLIRDTDIERSQFALDSVLYIGCEGWKSDYGGFTSYIAKGDDEEEDVFYSWINAIYLDPEVQAEIKRRFESESEIELENFLQPSKYEELKAAISNHDVTWRSKGPANKRCFMYADMEKVPQVIKECMEFLQSDAMFLILSHLTGLKLHKLYAPSDSEDSDDDSTEVGCRQGWKPDYGGFTSYIAKGDDEELLSIHPKENSLALVYRDKETLCFVKHLNSEVNNMPNRGFYDISTVYYE